jgi:hypothetical protein
MSEEGTYWRFVTSDDYLAYDVLEEEDDEDVPEVNVGRPPCPKQQE